MKTIAEQLDEQIPVQMHDAGGKFADYIHRSRRLDPNDCPLCKDVIGKTQRWAKREARQLQAEILASQEGR